MTQKTRFSADVLTIDCAAATDEICAGIRTIVRREFKKKGAVVGVSGGIDSSVVVALCARALGAERVLALQMPERESSGETLELSRMAAAAHGVETVHEDISSLLDAAGCYRRRDEAIRRVIPEYGSGWVSKIVLPSLVDGHQLRIFSVVAQSPDGREVKERMPTESYLGVVAATNFKQRLRKMLEYYHADRLNYAVAGTPNLLEYDLGFFVKNGDGSADIKPIAHLYKSQVFQLAEFLGVPEEIRSRPPTTDTYSLPQSQEEFYFALPYAQMDLCLFAYNHDVPAGEVAEVVGVSAEQVEWVYRDIEAKRRFTNYLAAEPRFAVDPSGV